MVGQLEVSQPYMPHGTIRILLSELSQPVNPAVIPSLSSSSSLLSSLSSSFSLPMTDGFAQIGRSGPLDIPPDTSSVVGGVMV